MASTKQQRPSEQQNLGARLEPEKPEEKQPSVVQVAPSPTALVMMRGAGESGQEVLVFADQIYAAWSISGGATTLRLRDGTQLTVADRPSEIAQLLRQSRA